MSAAEDELAFQVTRARDIVARRVVNRLINEDTLGCLWEDYPEIGEHDWVAVTKHAEVLVERLDPAQEKYDVAYAFLASRAGDEA
jgi:hypothetical protein